jgi:hypothetical protein
VHDASILTKQLAGAVPEPPDLVNLPSYEAYMKLMVTSVQTKTSLTKILLK